MRELCDWLVVHAIFVPWTLHHGTVSSLKIRQGLFVPLMIPYFSPKVVISMHSVNFTSVCIKMASLQESVKIKSITLKNGSRLPNRDGKESQGHRENSVLLEHSRLWVLVKCLPELRLSPWTVVMQMRVTGPARSGSSLWNVGWADSIAVVPVENTNRGGAVLAFLFSHTREIRGPVLGCSSGCWAYVRPWVWLLAICTHITHTPVPEDD